LNSIVARGAPVRAAVECRAAARAMSMVSAGAVDVGRHEFAEA